MVDPLDAAYRPIEPFDDWAQLRPRGEVWDRYVERYEAVRADADPGILAGLLRGAAFDTGAIEGLYAGDRGITHTLITEAATWEPYLEDRRGPEVVDYVKAHIEAFEMALDSATQAVPLSEAWIRRVHEVACAPQEQYEVTTPVGRQRHKLIKGAYKQHSNHVLQPDGTWFSYAPPHMVPAEMARLVDELRSELFQGAHPATQSAYAHHAFVRIHPFADGNGRVARVLASVPLLRALSLPLVIYADQRPGYYAALAAADGEDRQPVVDWLADRAVDTMALARLSAESGAGTRSRFLAAWAAASETSDEAIEPLLERFHELITKAAVSALGALRLPNEAELFHRRHVSLGVNDARYRVVGRMATTMFELRVQRVRKVLYRAFVTVGVARATDEPFGVRAEVKPGSLVLEARQSELEPDVSTSLRLRAEAFSRQLVNQMVDELSIDLA